MTGRPGPSQADLARLTSDRSAKILAYETLEELSGIDWALERKLTAPLTETERAAYAMRKAELQRLEARR